MKNQKILGETLKNQTRLGFIQAIKNYFNDESGEINLGDDAVEVSPEPSEEISPEGEQDSQVVENDEISEEISPEGEVEVQASNEQELEAEIKDAVENGADEEQVKSMIRKYNLKVDGKEIEEEIDLDNEEEMVKTLQLAKKSHKTMQEKAELERATADFLKKMRANPFEALKQLDPEFDEMSYVNEFIDNLIKENQMTPEEKENARIRQEYEQMIAERDALKKEAAERKRQEETQAILTQIKADITKELEADEDLVVNENNIALIAQEMIKAGQEGVELAPKQALDLAKKRIQNEYSQYANSFKSTASMKKYMGSELLERLKEDRIKAAQTQAQVKNAKTNPVSAPVGQEVPKKKLSLSDILRGDVSGEDLND